jgi:hypothetical protein
MLVSDVAEMAPIRAIEEETVKGFGHDIACFQTWADITAEALGVDGNYDDVMNDGRTFIDHFRSDLLANPSKCDCIEWIENEPNHVLQEEDDLAADRAYDLKHGNA